jgi:hypothetical protein
LRARKHANSPLPIPVTGGNIPDQLAGWGA